MRSSRFVGQRAQAGQSLVEALVASAILGIGVVAGLTAVDTMVNGANEATKQAAATCALRGEIAFLEAAPWSSTAPYGTAFDNVSVTVRSDDGQLQVLDVTAKDPAGRVKATATILKAHVLNGAGPPSTAQAPGGWCSYVLRAAP